MVLNPFRRNLYATDRMHATNALNANIQVLDWVKILFL